MLRVHRAVRGPWWFSSGTRLRFDLTAPRGTCYVAEEALGAFVEAFQGLGVMIPREEILTRRVSTLAVPAPLTLADCTDPHARAFGVTAEIHSSVDRVLIQAWAAAFSATGFDGVRYLVRHDAAQRRVGFALFGSAGEAAWPVASTNVLDADLLLGVGNEFGIRVL